jgi:hypothetical protein
VLDAWNTNNDPREVIKAVEGDEEAVNVHTVADLVELISSKI